MTELPTLIAIGVVIGAVFWRRMLSRHRAGQGDTTGPAALPFLGWRLSTSSSADDRDVERRIVDPRIHVFVSEHPGRSRQLLAIAAALKYRHAHEPIHLYLVADGGDSGGSVDDSTGRTLSQMVQETATSAPVSTQIVADHPESNAIVDQVCEESTDIVLVDWEEPHRDDGADTGRTVDRLLGRTRLPVYAAHTDADEIVVSRLHMMLPPDIDHYEGFYEAVYNVKQIASMHDAGITVYVFEGNVHQYQQLFDLVEIDVNVEFVRSDSWKDATRRVEQATEPTDFVVALAVRKEDQGWGGGFPEMSRRIRQGTAQSAAVFFLREDDPERDDHFLRI